MALRLVNEGLEYRYLPFEAGSLQEAGRRLAGLAYSDATGAHAAACEYAATARNAQVTVTGVWQQGGRYYASGVLSSVTIHHGCYLDLPRWTNVRMRSQAVQQEWTRYLQRLEVHERGHVSLVTPALEWRQFQFSLAAPCASKTDAARALEQAFLPQVTAVAAQLILQASARYDQNTRHGASQGAQLRADAVPNDCGRPNCRGHRSPSDVCPFYCTRAGCPGHSAPTHRCA